MTYEEAKACKQVLENKNNNDSDNLKKFDEYRNTIGIVPDHIREIPEYQALKKTFDQSFAELRNFNGWYVKTFKKEIQADRRKRRIPTHSKSS